MSKVIIFVVLSCVSAVVASASFPHKTVSYTSSMKGPMGMKVETESYTSFDGKNSVTAEWTTEKSFAGTSKKFNLSKGGFAYAVDLDTKARKCTKMDISGMEDMVEDPEEFGENIKKKMNLKEDGACEGGGVKGTKYTSSFGEICLYKDVLMLWSNAMGSKTVVENIKFDQKLPKEKITLPDGVDCKSIAAAMNDADSGQNGNGQMNQDEARAKAQEMIEGLGELFSK